MVLRSGIIIPFQFRENKKLLTVGVPEENRDLSIWDLKNVVRSAFGIYNFEFRNKKIGFSIPDELLLNYLGQRHDLTNFVIEIVQAIEESVRENNNEEVSVSYAASCSQTPNVSLPQLSHESGSTESAENPAVEIKKTHTKHDPAQLHTTNISTGHITPETLTQSIDPMDIIPKSEHDESELEMRNSRHEAAGGSHSLQTVHQRQHFHNFYRNVLPHSTPARNFNRFRRRGERMSKDQKEMYVTFFEENLCMLTQKRNDAMLEPLWHKLCSMLNRIPQGAVKNVEEWKQTFDAWRYRVFMYTRYNSKLVGAATQNPKNYKPLTQTDQRAYAMWTSHKSTAPQDLEKMDMFAQLDNNNADFDY